MNDSIKNADKKRMPRGKPFKKGEVHNPHGRPRKELSITDALRTLMDEVPTIKIGSTVNTDKTWAQLVALGMLLKATKGDASMAREIIDRLEGKVAQPVTGADGERLTFNLVVQSDNDKAALLEAKKRLG